MDTNSTPRPDPRTLSLSPQERWTLHHVLLDRIEQESTAQDPTEVDPPPVEVFQAFETLDSGRTRFTIEELQAMESVLATYHHSTTWWELERPRIESLLHRITERIDQPEAAPESENA